MSMRKNGYAGLVRISGALLLVGMLTGCAGVPGVSGADARKGAVVAELPDNRRVRVSDGVLETGRGCGPGYSLYRPEVLETRTWVVLAPGFLRRRSTLAELARQLAGRGIPTVTVDFHGACSAAGSHVRHGLALVRVARHFGARRVVYAGFSAGALAALVAAREDTHAAGVVALDLVDTRGLGAGLAPGLRTPLVGLIGESGACNAYNNGLGVYAYAPRVRVERMDGAGHCAFEAPTDWLCRLSCAETGNDDAVRARILKAAAAAITRLAMPASANGE